MPQKRQLFDTLVEGQITTDLAVRDVLTINPKTASYQLIATDQGKVVEVTSASASVITVPTNAVTPFPIGTVINICRAGAGGVTIAGAAGVTVNTALTLDLRAQWSEATLRKRSIDGWILSGDLTP